MYGDGDCGSYSFDGTDDEDDDDSDDVEHDVKDDLIVDSRGRLEQHNIMSGTISSRTADAGRTCNCEHEWWWTRSELLLKYHLTVVESLIVTTGLYVTRVAYSNSVQPRRVQSSTGAGWGCSGEGYHHRPPQKRGRGGGRGGGGIPWGGGKGGAAALKCECVPIHKYVHTYIHTYIHTNNTIQCNAIQHNTIQ